MSDRELLELAAKAAGIDGKYDSWTGQGFNEGIRQTGSPKEFKAWNPIRHDDQAFRLMNKLHLSPRFYGGVIEVCQLTDKGAHRVVDHHLDASCDIDAYTRRAIVRAAAAIGKKMQ